ncbi:hypothetical protein J7T55_008950 [Diaporthe amygdali]|uniref:uncharacterized protein n=1 Tax=Phomopsis amygdali TaxID=1214568 RepID=UPI0022FF292A|nr:uncharacterized protein J7T55_008950 [Diaporthe amygdali]KAJ0121783.1 hypothetical protein J7T55_008950 [Diaporthe amygdali]
MFVANFEYKDGQGDERHVMVKSRRTGLLCMRAKSTDLVISDQAGKLMLLSAERRRSIDVRQGNATLTSQEPGLEESSRWQHERWHSLTEFRIPPIVTMDAILNGPAMAPPAGETSDFENPPNENGLAIGVLVTMIVISTFCVLVRLYARVYLLRKVQVEENFAMVETPGYFVHTWNVRVKDMLPTQYYILVFGVCYSFVLPFLKVAILTEWTRMFVPRGTHMKNAFFWGCMTVCFVQIGAGVATIIALNLQCIPHAAIWDLTITDAQCFELYPLQVSSASIQLVSDIAIFLLPQRVIWTLKMTWQKRLGVSVVFGLGLLACVSAAFRLATTVAYGEAADAIYALGPLVFWATAEMTCGFFVCCMPCIPKILRDTGVLKNIKRAFGMNTTTTKGPSNNKSAQFSSNISHGKSVTATSKAYYKLDEDGIPMDPVESESTEQLHNAKLSAGITRTTRIIVSQDSRPMTSDVEAGNGARPGDHNDEWPRPGYR